MEFRSRPDICELHDAFTARRQAAFADFGKLDRAAFNWAPEAGRWSVAQCIDHLCQVGMQWNARLSPALFAALARSVHHRTPYHPGRLGQWVVASMETVGRPHKAPALFQPRTDELFDTADLLRSFDALGESWEATLRRASQLDLARLRVGSPAAPWLRMPLGTWLFALSAHEDRHLTQARRVLESPGFPG